MLGNKESREYVSHGHDFVGTSITLSVCCQFGFLFFPATTWPRATPHSSTVNLRIDCTLTNALPGHGILSVLPLANAVATGISFVSVSVVILSPICWDVAYFHLPNGLLFIRPRCWWFVPEKLLWCEVRWSCSIRYDNSIKINDRRSYMSMLMYKLINNSTYFQINTKII